MPSKKVTAKAPKGKKTPRKKAPKRQAAIRKSFPKRNPDDLIREINMKYGSAGPVVRSADQAWDASDLRRPSGIPSLDICTGGGLVAGKVHQFDGPESVGKNYLLYRYFANVQRNYGEDAVIAMACFESFVDKHFAQMCGCQIAMSEYDIEVTQRKREKEGLPLLTKEEIKTAMEVSNVGVFHIFEGPSEGVLDGIVDAVSSNTYQLIGIDSWDAMMTVQEDHAPLGETPQVASPASLQTRWSKKVLDAFNPVFRCPECGWSPIDKKLINTATLNYKYKCPHCEWSGLEPVTEVNETTVYCIRQVRAKINIGGGGKIMGRKYKTDGANALQHLNHIRVSLHPGQYLRNNKNVKIGKEVAWEIAKAKAGALEGATGGYTLYFSPLEVDVQGDLLAMCLASGVIVKEGKGRLTAPDIQADGKTFSVNGKENLLMMLEDDPEMFQIILEELYTKHGLGHVRFR